MSRWLDRPGYVAAIAFLGGIAAAILVVLIIILARGDDGDDPVAATATPEGTPTAGGPTPVATIPTGFADPVDALEALIRDVLESDYLGECPQLPPPAGVPAGLCWQRLHEDQDLATFLVGPPFSEALGEAIITRNDDETWSVSFLPAPAIGAAIAVGGEAMVFGVGACLNFRVEPSLSSEVRSCQFDGARAQVVEGPVTADGHTWWRLTGLGWASDLYLRPSQ